MSTGYDGANRPVTVTGNLSGQQSNYITQAAYWPQGDLYYFTRGNGVWHAAGYNSLLQPTEMYESLNNVNSTSNMLFVSCLNWGSSRSFGAALYNVCPAAPSTKNNGTLQGYTMMNGGPGSSQFVTFNQTFGYDNANRLMSATDSGGWSRNFGYDAYGNMWVSAFTGITPSGNAPQNQNQFTGTNQITGNSYDAAGNLLSVNGNTANYDAENQLVQVTEAPAAGGGIENLAYDGFGRRVEKLLPSAMSVYVYDAFGVLAASYSSAAAAAPCKTCYLSADHLGSVRLVTDQNGIVIARHDYLPFGEEIPANMAGRNSQWGSTVDVVRKFTGKERDQETWLDYFGARYYGSALGRFTSPDPEGLGSSTMDPQSWNMYAYARNNPLSYIDPYGFSYQICDASGKNCAKDQLSDDEFDQQKHAAQGNGEVFDNGTMYHTDANGNKVVDGTYRQTDVDLPGDAGTNRAAAGFIVASFNQVMKEFGKNAAFAVAGAGIGAGIEAINDARLASKAAAEAEDLARYRTAPVGRRGSPMEVGGNTGTEINGRYYTGHALDRMQGRGLVPSVVEDTIATGTKSAGNTPGTSVYTSSQARVVVNSGGDVVSVSPR